MKFRTLLRHSREGTKNIWRNGWMSFASVSSMCISLLLLGAFMLLAMNMNYMADQFESKIQISVYLASDLSEEKITEVQNKIGNLEEVSKVTFVTKEEGLTDLKERMGEENREVLEGYENDNNPLPDSFLVDVYDPQIIAVTAKQIEALNVSEEEAPIWKVNYGQGTVEKVFKITNAVRNIGFVVVIGLAVTAIFLISNTIRMTIVARRKEIGIMKMVGATNSFIRWPFFIEGALIGFFSSLLTTVIVWLGYDKLYDMVRMDLSLFMVSMKAPQDSMYITALILIGLGTLIGIWGSVISVRKYLKV
ncbi:permease-like cell division protein FtsX [Paenibacillus yanchengensis]|uniref:Cell division protein FtsX n=1 Tax=Paenibacillus yanchengensis TaxID=2035833 RepID=A0ABW4YN72_9BACL